MNTRMKKRELARRVEESGLLTRLGGHFALSSGRHLIHVAPVEHILAGFSFETIYVANSVRVRAFAMALAPPTDAITYSALLHQRDPVWDGYLQDEVGFPNELLEAMVEHVPFVLAHSQPKRYLRSRHRSRSWVGVEEEEAYVRVAAGKLGRARRDVNLLSRGRLPGIVGRVLSSLPSWALPADAEVRPVPAVRERAQQMLEALDAGPVAAQSLLRHWEDETLSAIRVSRENP
jgi:hypothetical protein